MRHARMHSAAREGLMFGVDDAGSLCPQLARADIRPKKAASNSAILRTAAISILGTGLRGARSHREASDALVDQMVARIANKTGSILDVACGLGGTTKRLTHTYPPEMITGINISEAQIADARALAPGCTFQVMNATKLGFPDNHFDAVICIESACCSIPATHFSKKLFAC
jgi:SAM-dependent methyltransferase